MRITGNTVVRRYLSNLQRNFSEKNKVENQIASNRGYNRASQNPIDAAKALKVRKAMAELKTYEYNLNTAKGIYETAESSVMQVSELIQSTYEKLIYGANGTQGDTEDEIIADSIRTFADEMVRLLNTTVADRTIFGGTMNKQAPFEIKGDTVYYHDVAVNDFQNPSFFPNSGSSYTDIGIGMYMGEDGRIDQQSALQVTFNGVEVMGCGLQSKTTTLNLEDMVGGEYSLDVYIGNQKKTISFFGGSDNEDTANIINDALEEALGGRQVEVDFETGVLFSRISGDPDVTIMNTPLLDEENVNYIEYDQAEISNVAMGFSNNIIQLTLDSAKCLERHDKTGAAQFADALFAIQTNLSLSIADIGNKEEFIDFNLERITNNIFSLSEQQNELEGTGSDHQAEEITIWKVMESVYNASLQISASVVPMSIFNFMN
ncbi:MAG: flagellar hook-associated protein FlgL [Eubacterium sp.]|nr:flagellar hook-associated protein FlgL [Eubacterium sp.]